MRRAVALALIADTTAGVAADEPAPVPAGAPVEVASLPVIGAPGPAGPMQLEAADADAGRLRNALAKLMRVADEGGSTRYVAHVMHPDRATRDRHEGLGFFDGWNTCITQLEALAQKLDPTDQSVSRNAGR